MCIGPHTLQHLYGLHSEEDVGHLYVVIFTETLDILMGTIKVLHEELEPLGFWVSWVKTKIQAFNDILDDAILSASVCGKDVEVTWRFTYLGSDIHVSAC